MTQQEIWYDNIQKLGFKEELQDDEIFEKQYGFPYKIITLKLAKGILVDWNQVTRTCQMIRLDKEATILGRIPIRNLDDLKTLIEFFLGKKDVSTTW